tara:strand:- start:3661 stop:4203 length:543 start_codon:yes stop_codon:yes gene_type:complete
MKESRDISYYLDKAKLEQGFKYDNQIDNALEFKGAVACLLRKAKMQLSPEKMVELSNLAKIDPAIALMDLAMWNTKGEANKTYAKILHKLSTTACAAIASAVVFTGAVASPAHAQHLEKVSSELQHNIYYGIKEPLKNLTYKFTPAISTYHDEWDNSFLLTPLVTPPQIPPWYLFSSVGS